PPYPTVIIANPDGSSPYTVPAYQFITVTNNKVSWVVPNDVPTGSKKWFYKTYSNERTPVNVTIVPFTKVTTGYDINFANESSIESNKNQIVNKFGALHKAWGGYANGGVVGDNVYFQDGKLVLEAHGDWYDGTVQGVNRDGTPKIHTIQGDPVWGDDPKLGQDWTNRVGCCIVSKDYHGFGRYLFRTKITQLLGCTPAVWLFWYSETYPELPEYEELLEEGLKREGGFSDGYYVVLNQEIDIEMPSHLAMGVFNGWLEVESNVIFFDINPQYHIGIQNDTQSSANNGLWKYNGAGNPNLRTNWTKVSTVVNPVYQPSFDNFKCNTWISETGSGSGYRFKDPSIPDTQNDEVYLANLTPIGQAANDDAFHDYEFRWYKDRVEFYFDGVLKQTNTSFIPDIPGRLTIG
ncbi:LamG domain-containing protein, partial [Chitinophaga sancti]